MSKAVVIGNGESRRGTDLKTYRSEYKLIGCNALHRDIAVDYLICCDRRMAAEATENIQTKDTLIYVRPSWFHYFRKIQKNKNIRLVPDLPYKGDSKRDDPDHWGSGGFAVLLGASLGFNTIELIGFDLYPIGENVNNIYKGTQNYSKAVSQPVDPSYWVYQIGQVFKFFPKSQFIIRNHQTWKIPQEWQKNNVTFVAL
jgi:hypothetical protein